MKTTNLKTTTTTTATTTTTTTAVETETDATYSALRADWRDIQVTLQNVFIPREVVTADIEAARSLMAKDLKIDKMGSAPYVRESLKAFLNNDSLDQKLCNFYNNINGEVSTSELAGLCKNLSIFKDVREYTFNSVPFTAEELTRGSISLGLTLANFLVYTGTGHMFEAERTSIDKDGNPETRTYLHVQFNANTDERSNLMHGINGNPGVIHQRFISSPPGGMPIKVRGKIKETLINASSRALQLVPMSDQFYYSLLENSKWYKQSLAKKMEVGASIKLRVDKYIDAIREIRDMDRVYLSMKFDYRYRLYTDMKSFFINPQAKDGKYLWQLANSRMLDDRGYAHMVHSAVGIALNKRHSLAKAMQYWNKHELSVRSALLKMGASMDELAESVYARRLLDAISDYRNRVPSKFILLKDFTTGGLIHHSITFHNDISAPMCNVAGRATPADAHALVAQRFGMDGLTRDHAKEINMQVLHGSSNKTAADTINASCGTSLSAGGFGKLKLEAYGAPINNVLSIVEFGRSMHSKYNTSLLFRTPEGWPTMSIAYTPSEVSNPRHGGTMLEFYMFTPEAQELKQGYRKIHTITTMPLTSDKNGTPIRGAKVSGLYANITHVVDGHILRRIYEENAVSLSIHDNIGACPNDFDGIEETAVNVMVEDYDARYYERCINDIKNNAAKDNFASVNLPVLYYGKLTKSQVKKSTGFLQA